MCCAATVCASCALFAKLGAAAGLWPAFPLGGLRPPDSTGACDHVWWLLDPSHAHPCKDCQRLAAKSPYDPPWAGPGSNQLNQTPGDGRTICGADCTCQLSYTPPAAHWIYRGEPLEPLKQFEVLLMRYTHGQIWQLVKTDQLGDVLAEPDMRRWPEDVPEGEADWIAGSGGTDYAPYVRPIIEIAPGTWR